MRKLNRSQPFGKVTPPEVMDGCDRAAHYAQDDRYFDQHDREIVPGQALVAPQVVPDVAGEGDRALPKGGAERLSPAELIAQVDTLPWARFHKEAKRILGASCPAGKQQVLDALKGAVAGFQARAEKRAGAASPGTPGAATPGPTPAAASSASAKAAAPGGVDLAAWGRGQKDYLFGEVQKAMRSQHSKQVTERRDAVDFLIEQGVITGAEARQDV